MLWLFHRHCLIDKPGNRWLFIFTATLFALFPLSVIAQSAHQSLRQGDSAYDKKEYREAETAYRQALAKNATDPVTLYNTGNTAYRQGRYPDAVSLYQDAAQRASEPALKAAALHNLGNAHLMQQQYREAIEAYENSLRLRPGDPGAKGNLQLAKKKLREEEQKEPQNQEQNQQNQDQNQQDQDQDQPQDPQKNDQSQQPAEQQPPTPQPATPQPGKMTPERARRQLETSVAPADQRTARRYRENQRRPERPRPKKDW